jgi:hypothetical protein
MDTEEMYERGVADAERGELHPFYYQHYYHYRRGYDRTRRRLRRPRIWGDGKRRRARLVLVASVLVALGAAFLALRSRAQPTTSTRTPVAVQATHVRTPIPTRTPIFPTDAPPPTPAGLHVGGMALVTNTGGAVLRGRAEPGLQSPARVAFKEGEQVRILEGPVEADGYTWWRIEGPSGVGWSAQGSKEGVMWLQPLEQG